MNQAESMPTWDPWEEPSLVDLRLAQDLTSSSGLAGDQPTHRRGDGGVAQVRKTWIDRDAAEGRRRPGYPLLASAHHGH